jgi:hypothetical protein
MKKSLKMKTETVKILAGMRLDEVRGAAAAPGSLHCTEKGNSLCVQMGCA